jgi:DNA-binding SARP family transcriptional activator
MKLKNNPVEISIRTFGGLTIYCNGAPVIISWSSQKARLFFCYLLITSDQWVHRDRFIELLWPGCSHDSGAKNLKTTLSRLRRSLRGTRDRDPILCQGDAYRLNFEAITCDCSVFRSEAVAGIRLMTRGDVVKGREHLEIAQELYTAEFLPEEPSDPFIVTARRELAGLYETIMNYLDRIYASENRSDLFASLRGLTHFPDFPHTSHRKVRMSPCPEGDVLIQAEVAVYN